MKPIWHLLYLFLVKFIQTSAAHPPPRFPELLSRLPPEVHRDRYCQRLLASLEDLSRYMAGVGPARMSKRRLIAVLGTLRPWELCSPEISTAIEVGGLAQLTHSVLLYALLKRFLSFPSFFPSPPLPSVPDHSGDLHCQRGL